MQIARLAALGLLLLSTATIAAIPDYDVVPITPAGTNGTANDVTPQGLVVGCYTTGTPARRWAYAWKDGTLTPLWAGCATQASDGGVIAGNDSPGQRIVIWDGTQAIDIGYSDGFVRSVNDAGYVLFSDDADRSYVWYRGQVTPLPVPCSDMNNANRMICSTDRVHEFFYQYPTGETAPIPPAADGTDSQYYYLGRMSQDAKVANFNQGLLVYANGATQHWTNVPAGIPLAVGINGSGLVFAARNGGSGYLADGNGYRELMSYPAVQAAGFTSVSPTGLNDRGWISAIAGGSSGSQAILLTPHAAASSTFPGLAMKLAKRGDYNADFRGDLLWQSTAGRMGVWLMDSQTTLQAASIPVPSGATFVLRADFNGDGHSDLLLRDAAGAYYVAIMDQSGTMPTTTKVLVGGSGWEVAGSGDFNADLKADLLWWHPTQGYGVWLMNGAATMSAGGIASPSNARPIAIADFNNDLHEDVLWMTADGRVDLYTMNGAVASFAGTVRAAGSGFAPVAIGDFNHDGIADIVWAHPDGRQSLWLMSGAMSTETAELTGAGSGWSVIGAADLNGDAASDLLWKSADGSYGAWTMSGTARLDNRLFISGGTGWRLVGAWDLGSDAKSDLVWQRDDGTVGVWIMNGLDPTWTGVVLGAGSGWSVVP